MSVPANGENGVPAGENSVPAGENSREISKSLENSRFFGISEIRNLEKNGVPAGENPVPVTAPLTALAPMQDITVRPFLQLIASPKYGAPDIFVTEFLRVHATSSIDADIAETLRDEPSLQTPIFLQLIGEDVPALVRIARLALSTFPRIAGIDLNLGCPAPKVYRKNVGGGLLKDLPHAHEILRELRRVCDDFGKPLSAKCRLGFDDESPFENLLEILAETVDWATIHGRTVKGLYRAPVNYSQIAHAAEFLRSRGVPVLANGDISSPQKAEKILAGTHCAGVMIGRHAIRNPWIFRQICDKNCVPVLADVFDYIRDLAAVVAQPNDSRERIAARMKKYLNFVGTSIDEQGEFLHFMRRAGTPDEIFSLAEKFCLGPRAEIPFPPEPFPHLIARPNCEV